MMNGGIVLVALLPTINGTYRDKLLSTMTSIASNAYANEPGVRQFALLVPRDETGTKTLYSIERYTDQAAFQSHINTSAVRDMFDWINSADVYETPPTVHQLTALASNDNAATSSARPDQFEFTRPALSVAPDPFVVFRQVNYAGGADAANASLPFWKAVVEMAGTTPENGDAISSSALAYGVFGSASAADCIYTLSAYPDERVYHQNAAAEGGEDGIVGTQPVYLKLKGGFLYKPE